MLRTHKIKLDPNQAQAIYFARACGVARHAYNWALAEWKRQHEAGLKPDAMKLNKQYNAIKRTEFPWALEVTKNAPQQAIKNVGAAYKNFFRRVKESKPGVPVGYPKFKKKGVRDSFRADPGPKAKGISSVKTDGCKIQLPIIGWIRMRTELRFSGCIQAVTVSRAADGWYAAVLVETEDRLKATASLGPVGIDMGLKALATLSTGEVITGPKPHRALDARMRRLNRSLARKQKGSANSKKAKAKLAKLHKKIADIREDATNKLSHQLATQHDTIVLEDLNVGGMSKNRHLARSVADAAMRSLRTKIEYKAKMTGSQVIVADRWFPSSKTCSGCGRHHPEIVLGVDTLRCDCGLVIDRDLNAATNLANYAASPAVSACGEEGSDAASAA